MPNLVKVTDFFPVLLADANAETVAAMHHSVDAIVQWAKSFSRYDTGEMFEGWQGEVHTHGIEGASFTVFNPVPHTVYNEYGTVYMTAQPMIRPALELAEEEIFKRLRDAWFG